MERPLGVSVVAAIYFLFGFAGIVLYFLGYPFETSHVFITVFVLLVSAVGLVKLKRWGWYLAVSGCIISLIVYGTAIKQWFPLLEIFTLPYLVGQREIFEVTKRIKKKWLKITFVVLVIATTIWGISFYWTQQEYNNYNERFWEWYSDHWKEAGDVGSVPYYNWNGGVYICRTVFLLFCAWIVFIVLWRTRLETIDEMKKRAVGFGNLQSSSLQLV